MKDNSADREIIVKYFESDIIKYFEIRLPQSHWL